MDDKARDFAHLKLEIAVAIPASSERQQEEMGFIFHLGSLLDTHCMVFYRSAMDTKALLHIFHVIIHLSVIDLCLTPQGHKRQTYICHWMSILCFPISPRGAYSPSALSTH